MVICGVDVESKFRLRDRLFALFQFASIASDPLFPSRETCVGATRGTVGAFYGKGYTLSSVTRSFRASFHVPSLTVALPSARASARDLSLAGSRTTVVSKSKRL